MHGDQNGRIINLGNLDKRQTVRMNEIMREHKAGYVREIERLAEKYGWSEYWWMTPLSSHNLFLSGALHNVCRLLLAIEAVEKEGAGKVLIPEQCIYAAFNKYKRRKKLDVSVEYTGAHNKKSKWERWKMFARQCRELERKGELLKSEACKRKAPGEPFTLIDTYMLAESFQGGKYNDRYFTGIQEGAGKECIVFTPLFYGCSYEELRRCARAAAKADNIRVLFKEQFLDKADYRQLWIYPLMCFFFMQKEFFVHGIDIAPIINHDLQEGIFCANSLSGLLNYHSVRKMAKEKIPLKRLIYWYEGQPSSNLLNLAYRRFYPASPSLAYVGFPVTENMLGVAATRQKSRKRAAPTAVGIVGSAYENCIRQFYGKVRLKLLPALRIRYIYESKRCDEGSTGILVVLPFSISAGSHMLRCVAGYAAGHNVSIAVKNHPANAGLGFRQYGIDAVKGLKFVQGTLQDCLEGINIVITSGTSTATIELLLLGYACILFYEAGKGEVMGVPELMPEDRYRKVYDEADLAEGIEELLGREGGGEGGGAWMERFARKASAESIRDFWI